MAILVTCPSCGRRFRVKNEHSGKRRACPKCEHPLVVEGEQVSDYDVFISHSQKDKAVADAVCAALEQSRVRCWMAPRDIPAGKTWASAIIAGIEESQVMVLVFSADSNNSEQVLREVERAVAKSVVILPFRIDDTAMSKDMEYFLSARHWLDALAQPLEAHLEHLVKRVRGLLEEQRDIKPTPAAATPDKPAPEPSGAPVEALSFSISKRTAGILATVAGLFLLTLCVALWHGGQARNAGDERDAPNIVQGDPAGAQPIPEPFGQGHAEDAGVPYLKTSTGVIADLETGFEWYIGPDEDTTWDEANAWVESLTVDGGGWRMPTVSELVTLHQPVPPGEGRRHIAPEFLPLGREAWSGAVINVWSGEAGATGMRGVALDPAVREWCWGGTVSESVRAFAVRSRRTQ